VHRLFLDANVLFAAAHGPPSLLRLWELARENKVALLTSAYARGEARMNLAEEVQRHRLDELVREVALVPEVPATMSCPIPLPAKDRPVLLAAVPAQATRFLTGDRRHSGAYFSPAVAGMIIDTPRPYFAKYHA
jgi:predicted nucleic acid-binding protein